MSMIDDIKRDREADRDPESPKGWKTGPVIWDPETQEATYVLVGRKVANPIVHSRIARLPDLEAAYLAEVERSKALAEALGSIARECDGVSIGADNQAIALATAVQVARAALAECGGE